MHRFLVIFFTTVLLMGGSSFAGTSTTRPMPGVTLEQITQEAPPLRYFVVTIDLTMPGTHIKVSPGEINAKVTPPWETTLLPVSQIAQRDGLAVAVNGNFFGPKDYIMVLGLKVFYFEGNWARLCGWAMSDGKISSSTPVDRDWPSLVVDDTGRIRMGKFISLPASARQVVSGIAQIITEGNDTATPDDDSSDFAQQAPRTVVGIDRKSRILTFLVCDGRRPEYSLGLTHHQLAVELLKRGIWNALVLDGGGSSTLAMRGGDGVVHVINRPSDGHDFPLGLSAERAVGNALGVKMDFSNPVAATQPQINVQR